MWLKLVESKNTSRCWVQFKVRAVWQSSVLVHSVFQLLKALSTRKKKKSTFFLVKGKDDGLKRLLVIET